VQLLSLPDSHRIPPLATQAKITVSALGLVESTAYPESMDPWVFWLAAALVLGIVEVVSGGTLIFGMVAAGALAGSATAAATDSSILPWIVFAGTSAAMLAVVRPFAKRQMRAPGEIRSGAAALVGQEAAVTAEVSGADGRVKLAGEIWSARSFDGETSFDVGERVRVLEIDGATALVA
jgi:membrane protein implicated in regulation of membrane protease activity